MTSKIDNIQNTNWKNNIVPYINRNSYSEAYLINEVTQFRNNNLYSIEHNRLIQNTIIDEIESLNKFEVRNIFFREYVNHKWKYEYKAIHDLLIKLKYVTVVADNEQSTIYSIPKSILYTNENCLILVYCSNINVLFNTKLLKSVGKQYNSQIEESLYDNNSIEDGELIATCNINISCDSYEYYNQVLLSDVLKKSFLNNAYPVIKTLEDSIKFYMIAGNNAEGYYLTSTNMPRLDVDIDNNYNDHVSEFYNSTNEFIKDPKRSGLVLMKGLPGSGKTSIINKFISDNPNTRFIYITDYVMSMFNDPSFVSFLLSLDNIVLILEDQEDMLRDRQNNHNPLISILLNSTSGLLSASNNIKIIMTFNYNTKSIDIDSALLRKGRLVASVNIDKLSLDKTKALADKLGINSDDIKEELTLADIYNYNADNVFGEDSTHKQSISFMKSAK